MSAPLGFLRSAPRHSRKIPSVLKFCQAWHTPLQAAKPSSRSLTVASQDHGAYPIVCFTGAGRQSSIPDPNSDFNDPNRKSDERTVKLGKTLRILQERLPSLLQSPLPQEILSPQITLHLFPSTHPHLPTVSGRVAYSAALWTSPIAWGRVPIVGNVKLQIITERMIRSPRMSNSPLSQRSEQLIVRWQTIGKTKNRGTGGLYKGRGASGNVDKITEWLGGGKGEDDSKEFTGLFIFEFDEEGRIVSHTIEHVQEGGNWERGVGARVVGLTDWLLGGMRNGRGEGTPSPACTEMEHEEKERI